MNDLVVITKEALSALVKEAVGEVLKDNMIQINHIEHKPIMTIDETCEFLNITKQTLSLWAREGKITQYGIGGRIYYRTEDILNKSLIPTN